MYAYCIWNGCCASFITHAINLCLWLFFSQCNLRQLRAPKVQSGSSSINVPVSQIYWKRSIKMENFPQYIFRIIKSLDYFYTVFLPSFLAASRRTPAGLTMDLFEQHQGTHILQVRRWSFIFTFLNILFLHHKQKRRSQFMLFAGIYHFSSLFFVSFETVTWWICIGIGGWRSLFVYKRNSFHLFGTFTGKQNHSSSVPCICIYCRSIFSGEGGRFEEATKIFLCALRIYFVCTCILNDKIGQAHLEKIIQLQKHHNFHEISNLFPYFVGKFMKVFDKYSDWPELKHTL